MQFCGLSKVPRKKNTGKAFSNEAPKKKVAQQSNIRMPTSLAELPLGVDKWILIHRSVAHDGHFPTVIKMPSSDDGVRGGSLIVVNLININNNCDFES